MAAALPYCDVLLPADDVRSLAAVVADLCRSDTGRPDPPRTADAAQLQSVTCTDGLKWPTLTPEPRSIAWVARGVLTNRVSSAAAVPAACVGHRQRAPHAIGPQAWHR